MLQDIDNTRTEYQNVARKLANVLTGEDANVIQEHITQAQAALNDRVEQSLLLNIAVGLSAHLPSSIALKELQMYLKITSYSFGNSVFSDSVDVPFVPQLSDTDAATAAMETIEPLISSEDNDDLFSKYFSILIDPIRRTIVAKLSNSVPEDKLETVVQTLATKFEKHDNSSMGVKRSMISLICVALAPHLSSESIKPLFASVLDAIKCPNLNRDGCITHLGSCKSQANLLMSNCTEAM